MKLSSSILISAVACALVTSSAQATDHASLNNVQASKSEVVGVGTGAIIGAAIGGPVGAILGAALGGHYGDTHHQSNVYEIEAMSSLEALKISRSKLLDAMSEQERVDFELKLAQNELDELTQRIDNLFVERALVDGLQFDVHFDTGSDALDEPDRDRLRRLSELLSAVPEAEVELYGFTDVRGDDQYNEVLSMDRAHKVAETLNALGVAQSQIQTHALGESRSADRVDVDAYSHDRRVSIRLQLPVNDYESEPENVNADAKVNQVGIGQ